MEKFAGVLNGVELLVALLIASTLALLGLHKVQMIHLCFAVMAGWSSVQIGGRVFALQESIRTRSF
jgi:hypothetical protein